MAIQWIHLRFMTEQGGRYLVAGLMNTFQPVIEMLLFALVKGYW